MSELALKFLRNVAKLKSWEDWCERLGLDPDHDTMDLDYLEGAQETLNNVIKNARELILALYDEPIPDYGDVMTVEQFRANVKCGGFIDYDGYGYPARDDKVSMCAPIVPSRVHEIPKEATHVVWFNR